MGVFLRSENRATRARVSSNAFVVSRKKGSENAAHKACAVKAISLAITRLGPSGHALKGTARGAATEV
jgi:hypothetical protein